MDKALNAKLVELADGNLESKSLGCGGICCNGRKLVSVEGGDCSKRSILRFPFFRSVQRESKGKPTHLGGKLME